MEFGWIKIFGIAIVVLIMIPNIIYAIISGNEERAEEKVPIYLSICEQIGRYGCIVLIWMPLFVWKFGFRREEDFAVYLCLNILLILLYYIIWFLYFKKRTLIKGLALAIIPTMIFLISGILLHHWSLVAAAFLFGVGHISITYITHQENN